MAIARLREHSRVDAIGKLTDRIPSDAFEQQFGAGTEQLDTLVANNTVTIARLMELLPEGTVNPSSGLYNSTMYLMSGLLAIALVANLLVRPVSAKHHAAE